MIQFINSGYCSHDFNMALDEYLLSHGKGLFLRIYGWSSPTISIGYGQKVSSEIFIDKTAANKIEVVRRLTGGRAVLHDMEVTYSVVADIGGIFGYSLNETYSVIADGLKQMLDIIGVNVEIVKGTVADRREKEGASLPCFASTSRHEIVVKGKKIIGSAQRREKNRFLQHGSLIIRKRYDITDYLNIPIGKKNIYQRSLEAESIMLCDVCDKNLSLEDFAIPFQEAFSKTLRMPVISIDKNIYTNCSEMAKLRLKYLSNSWNKV